ncbi:MAG: hypothetical protein ACRCWG_04030 [Sarcina sp.]
MYGIMQTDIFPGEMFKEVIYKGTYKECEEKIIAMRNQYDKGLIDVKDVELFGENFLYEYSFYTIEKLECE